MRLRRSLSLAVLFLALPLASCEPPKRPGPKQAMVERAAAEAGVPVDLMLAIADVEGGLRHRMQREVHPDELVKVAGVLELRHGLFDSLARGAELMQRSEDELAGDLALGTEAGGRVLADLAREEGLPSSASLDRWASVVERLSGHRGEGQRKEYRARVFALLRKGGSLRAGDGETIVLAPHPEIPVELTFAPPLPKVQGGQDFPDAIWFPTDCTDKCNTTRDAEVSMIAIHDTEGDWDSSVATLQNDPGKSVHYIIDFDGSRIGQFIPESYNGWHVGNSYFNNRMVGIEHVGVASVDDYHAAMYAASAVLVKDIAARHAVPLDRSHIVAHQEVPDGVNIPQSSPPCPDSPGACIDSGNYGGSAHHHDPGIYWEWCQYMEMVGGSCKCNDTFELWNCVHDLTMMNRCNAGTVEIVHCADACVVEPIGTDDHCTPVSEGGGGAGGSSATGGGGGAGGALSGAGGAGGTPDTGAGGAGEDVVEDCSCKAGAVDRGAEREGLSALVLAIGLATRRGKRRSSAPRA